MKRLFLLGLILLISMTTVLATFSSTIKFSGEILSDNLPVKYRSGYYVWGTLNRLQPVQVTVTNNGLNNVIIPTREYWASGYVKFNNIAVGERTPVRFFNTIISENDPNDPLGDYIIQYPKVDADINPTDFYVERKDRNTYQIVCNNVPIKTRAVVRGNYPACPPSCPPWVEENIPWYFTATMTV